MMKALFIALAIIAVAAGVVIHRTMDDRSSRILPKPSQSNSHAANHSASVTPARVPAYQSALEAQTVKATLDPAQFVGKHGMHIKQHNRFLKRWLSSMLLPL